MSEVRIELRHTKTVTRQSQDETWSYETRAKTGVETEPRQIRVNMCLEIPSLIACISGCTLFLWMRYYNRLEALRLETTGRITQVVVDGSARNFLRR